MTFPEVFAKLIAGNLVRRRIWLLRDDIDYKSPVPTVLVRRGLTRAYHHLWLGDRHMWSQGYVPRRPDLNPEGKVICESWPVEGKKDIVRVWEPTDDDLAATDWEWRSSAPLRDMWFPTPSDRESLWIRATRPLLRPLARFLWRASQRRARDGFERESVV